MLQQLFIYNPLTLQLEESHSSTSAVGNRGTANCSRPWIWICMVVRYLWKMVRGCEGLKKFAC